MHLMQVAFMRLHLMKVAQRGGFGDNFRFRDQEVSDPEDPYRGWDDYQPSYPTATFFSRVEINNRETTSPLADDHSSAPADEDSGLSSADAELELVHEDWTDYFQRGYGPMRPGYEPPSNLQHGREYSSDEDGDGPSLNKITFLQAWPFYSHVDKAK